MKLNSYKQCFKDLYTWGFGTAACHFVIFLTAFLLLCFAYAHMEHAKNMSYDDDTFIFEFESYLTLIAGILFLIPLVFSLLLTYALQHKIRKFLILWIVISVVFSILFGLGLLGAGIFLLIKGSYIGYISVTISILFGALMIHSILIVYYISTNFKQNTHLGSDEFDV